VRWGILAAAAVAGALFVWERFVSDPRRRAAQDANTRLFECAMARKLVEAAVTKQGRDEILSAIFTRRPSMPAWPEWSQVWGSDDPFRTDLLH